MTTATHDPVNHPRHYTYGTATCSCGVPMECIDFAAMLPFCEGNALKYLWRAGHKGDLVEDLKKALWYIERAIGTDGPVASRHPDAWCAACGKELSIEDATAEMPPAYGAAIRSIWRSRLGDADELRDARFMVGVAIRNAR